MKIRVKLRNPLAKVFTAKGTFRDGEVVDLRKELAENLIQRGLAESLDGGAGEPRPD